MQEIGARERVRAEGHQEGQTEDRERGEIEGEEEERLRPTPALSTAEGANSQLPTRYHPAMFVLYELLLVLGLILALPYFLITGLLRGKYIANFPERLGFYRTPASALDLWIHAVSVGETIAARPVVDAILRRRPGTTIVFTRRRSPGRHRRAGSFPSSR